MPDIVIHKAEELATVTKAAVESELGRPIRAEEEVSIMAFLPQGRPTAEERDGAARDMREYLERVHARTKNVPEQELEESLEEAMRHVRPGYREIK